MSAPDPWKLVAEKLRAKEIIEEDFATWKPMPHQIPPEGDWFLWLLMGGRGCVAPWTRVFDPITGSHNRIDDLAAAGKPITVLGLGSEGAVLANASVPFLKGQADLWEFELDDGTKIAVTDQHRFLTSHGWTYAALLPVGHQLGCADDRLLSNSEFDLSASQPDAHHSKQTTSSFRDGCPTCSRCGGQRLRSAPIGVPGAAPLPVGAHARSYDECGSDGRESGPSSSRPHPGDGPHSKSDCVRCGLLPQVDLSRVRPSDVELFPHSSRAPLQFQECSCSVAQVPAGDPHQSKLSLIQTASILSVGSSHSLEEEYPLPSDVAQLFGGWSHELRLALLERSRRSTAQRSIQGSVTYLEGNRFRQVVAKRFLGRSDYYDMHVPGVESYLAEGVWNHNTGKTDAGAMWFDQHMSGPPCDTRVPGGHRGSIIAPTLGDGYESCVMGPSGLKAHNPLVTTVTRKGGTYVIWPNGAEARIFGAYTPNDVERLRAGGNRCAVWGEELAAWRQLKKSWDHMRFGLRVGPHPQVVATTTPKPRKHLKKLVKDSRTVITSAKTEDNLHLAQEVRDALYEEYEGTRLGKQELGGQMLEDVPGAVATLDQLDEGRRDTFPKLQRRIVMVDPSQTNTETSDDCGITVQGRAGDEVFLLEDGTEKLSVGEWADKAVVLAVKWDCPSIWYESTGGSDAYGDVINSAIDRYNKKLAEVHEQEFGHLPKKEQPRLLLISLKVEGVPAQLSKRDRAVVLEMAIQQTRYHLVGSFPKLEEQLTTWVPGLDEDEDEDNKQTAAQRGTSPNNMDAAVHGFRVLMNFGSSKGTITGKQIRAARLD